MTCPHCQIQYNAHHWGECPHCGRTAGGAGDLSIPPVEGVFKTSTILISTDDGGVFGSIEEVPQPLRETLVACTTGANAATIVIADQGGRARMAAALRPLVAASALATPGPMLARTQQFHDRFRRRIPFLVGAGVLVAGFSGGLAWLVISHLK